MIGITGRPTGSGRRSLRAARTPRALVPGAVAVGLALGLVLAGCAPQPEAVDPTPRALPSVEPTPSPTPSPTPTPTPTPTVAPLPVGQPPAQVSIPAMELTEPLIDLGIQADGSMEVPSDFSEVGWFTGGGRPGGVGPTVIAGHVDSSAGPAVFFRLKELVPGDVVQVTDVAGATFDYTVTRAGDYPKNDFPTAEVFGATTTDELRLITCTGLFDRSVGHYEDNRVVFATRS